MKYIERIEPNNKEQLSDLIKFLIKNNIPINTKRCKGNVIYTLPISNSKHNKVKDEIFSRKDIYWIGIETIKNKDSFMIIQTNNERDFKIISEVADSSKITIAFQMINRK